MTSTAHETLQLRPPTPSHIADVSWASLSPTVRPRHIVFPVTIDGPDDGVRHDDPYVRTYWVAAIGAQAVTDLLRISRAARNRAGIRRPVHLATLLTEHLVAWQGDRLLVPDPIPRLGPVQLERIRRSRHRRLLA
jgi:hypothetical protein